MTCARLARKAKRQDVVQEFWHAGHHLSKCLYVAVCFYCKKPNHQSRECPSKKAKKPPVTHIPDEYLKSNCSASAEVSAAAATSSEWLARPGMLMVDSGA